MLWNFWGCGPRWYRPWRPYRPMGCGCLLVPILFLLGMMLLCGMLTSCFSWYGYGGYYYY